MSDSYDAIGGVECLESGETGRQYFKANRFREVVVRVENSELVCVGVTEKLGHNCVAKPLDYLEIVVNPGLSALSVVDGNVTYNMYKIALLFSYDQLFDEPFELVGRIY
jgi:hypothetical protein